MKTKGEAAQLVPIARAGTSFHRAFIIRQSTDEHISAINLFFHTTHTYGPARFLFFNDAYAPRCVSTIYFVGSIFCLRAFSRARPTTPMVAHGILVWASTTTLVESLIIMMMLPYLPLIRYFCDQGPSQRTGTVRAVMAHFIQAIIGRFPRHAGRATSRRPLPVFRRFRPPAAARWLLATVQATAEDGQHLAVVARALLLILRMTLQLVVLAVLLAVPRSDAGHRRALTAARLPITRPAPAATAIAAFTTRRRRLALVQFLVVPSLPGRKQVTARLGRRRRR